MNHLTYITQVCPHPQCNCSYDNSQGTVLWILCQIFKDDILQLKFILLTDDLKFVETWEKKSKDTRYIHIWEATNFCREYHQILHKLEHECYSFLITLLLIWKQTKSYQLQGTCNREIELLYTCTGIIYSVTMHVFLKFVFYFKNMKLYV